MTVAGVARFERLFREAAGLDIDKDDLKRLSDFLPRKLHDLLLRAEAQAQANDRDVVQPWDLALTRGLQEGVQEFRKLEADLDLDLEPILEGLAQYPPLDLALATDTEEQLPLVLGGLTVVIAHTVKAIEPSLERPHSAQWQAGFRVIDALL